MYATQSTSGLESVMSGGTMLMGFVFGIIALVSQWKVFVKAGRPGWAILVPIYSAYVLLKIAGRPWWWMFLMLIPIVSFVVAIQIAIDIAHAFGKSTSFAIWGLFIFSIIGYIILGFGDATYTQPHHE